MIVLINNDCLILCICLQDYFNFTSNSDKVTLPPLDPGYSPITAHDQSHPTHYTSHEVQQFKVPKTFSTRKGALLLFSEDLAQRYKTSDADIHQHGAVSASGIHSKVAQSCVVIHVLSDT